MQKIAIKYGLIMFAGFTGLFLIAHLLGVSENFHLRILNGIIHISLLYFVIKDYRQTFPDSYNNYISGVAVGMYASLVGVTLFTIFMSVFFTFIDPALFDRLQAQLPLDKYFNEFTACLFIFVEGVVVSLVGSYIVTRVIDANLEKKMT